MPHANWQKRLACQRRWRRENRAKVRAQKRRARIKKKCLSKSLVVVLDDYRKRMSNPVTKTLLVVLEDYRLKKLPTPPPKNKEKIKTKTDYYRRDYYRRNRERILAQRKECRQRNLERYRAQERERTSRRRYRRNSAQGKKRSRREPKEQRIRRKEWRQRNLEKCRAQSRASSRRYRQKSQAVERQKEWRRKNREVINERRREHRRQHRDAINRAEREHRRQHRDAINRAEREYRRERKRSQTLLAARTEVPTTPCDCGLCLTCGGYETQSWSHNVVVPRSDPLEAMEHRLDRLEAACSDTSSEVDPRLEEELERLLNEASSDEVSESEEEEDVVEQRLASLRRNREEDMTQRLARWEKEEAVTDLSAELGGVRGKLRDMERWFERFHREDEAQPDEYTQTLIVTSHLMNELERFLFSNK